MRRRDFITLLGGAAAAAWPLGARAQQRERTRRIGVLMSDTADDPEAQVRLAAFLQGLQEFGWSVGRNARIDIRWSAGRYEDSRRYAGELAALTPRVSLASGTPAVAALQQALPAGEIVFVLVVDPVGAGFVESLARPGRNITGFMLREFGMAAKWLEMLKEIGQGVTRVAVLRDPAIAQGGGQLGAIQAVASSFKVELSPIDVRDAQEIERAIATFAQQPNGGLIVTGSPLAEVHRDLITALAARYRVPTIYPNRSFVVAYGGLLSYGADVIDQYRRAAGYVDRILKGEKPADLPVQAPTKYELVINLKTAKTLGLEIPPSVLARADEVIE
jgi:putative ABC transport system substrate-binding protein